MRARRNPGAPSRRVSVHSKLPRRSRGPAEARAATGRPPPRPAASRLAVARAGQPRPRPLRAACGPGPPWAAPRPPGNRAGALSSRRPQGSGRPWHPRTHWQRLRLAPMTRGMNSAGVASAARRNRARRTRCYEMLPPPPPKSMLISAGAAILGFENDCPLKPVPWPHPQH